MCEFAQIFVYPLTLSNVNAPTTNGDRYIVDADSIPTIPTTRPAKFGLRSTRLEDGPVVSAPLAAADSV